MTLFERLQKIFRETFEEPQLMLTRSLVADDVELWDSLTYIDMMAKVEEAFGVKIPFEKVLDFQEAGDLLDYLEEIVETQS